MNDDIKDDLERALKMLGMITINGDAVDVMAASKQKIRKVLALLESEAGANGR